MEKQPEVLKKMVAVEGDVGIIGLGFSRETLEQLKGVSVIFHSAASVRFDDILQSAIILNTRGTHEVIKFAQTLNNLASFVHVSTTYCYPDQRFIDEKVKINCETNWNRRPRTILFECFRSFRYLGEWKRVIGIIEVSCCKHF